MKKIYSLCLLAVMVMASGMTASAQLSLNLKWNLPDALEVYIGGKGDSYKVNVGSVTEYTATINDTWGSTYIASAPGYVITSAVASDGTVLKPIYDGSYNINMETYNGKTINVTLEKIVYDASFEINVVNGRDVLMAKFWGTKREISFKTGVQTIAYSSKYEQGIDIQAPVNDNAYLKQDGIAMEWKAYYAFDSYMYHKDAASGNKGFPLTNGTKFEVKCSDTADAEEADNAVVTVNYANTDALNAVTMIFNVTQMKTINEREQFEVKAGDQVRIMFNTLDYTVAINGNELTPSTDDDTTPYLFTVNGDMTLNVSVNERVYGNVDIQIAARNLDGLVLRAGAFNGPVMDNAQGTLTGTKNYSYQNFEKVTKKSALNIYTFSVSEKSPKIFVEPASGWWFDACEYQFEGDLNEAGIASPDYLLHVVDYELNPDTKLVVYVAADNVTAKVSDVMVRDRNRNSFTVAAGYNEFMIDPEYATPITVGCVSENEATMAVYSNMSAVAVDSETGTYSASISDDTVLHIYAGRPAPSQYTVSAYITPDAEGYEVIVDRVHKLTPANNSQATFNNCEVSVTPGANQYLYNGSEAEFEGTTHTSTVTGGVDIVIGDITRMELTPANGEKVEEFVGMVISFPNATIATLNSDKVASIKLADDEQFNYTGISVTAVAGASVPTFKLSVTGVQPESNGNYYYTLPAGLFTVQGMYQSAETAGSFQINNGTTTGIETIEAEGVVTVVDLAGRTLLRQSSTASINSLAKGMYIINGKKVVVK